MPKYSEDNLPLPPAIELQRIVSLREAAKLCGLNPETIRRVYRDKLIRLSPNRLGIRVGHALQLNKPAA